MLRYLSSFRKVVEATPAVHFKEHFFLRIRFSMLQSMLNNNIIEIVSDWFGFVQQDFSVSSALFQCSDL